jgi:glutaredoxin 2
MAESYVLYQYDSCPFCARVRRFLDARGIDLPMRDTLRDPAAFRELLLGGGRATVPCLRIETEDGDVSWLYESADIVDYLAARR